LIGVNVSEERIASIFKEGRRSSSETMVPIYETTLHVTEDLTQMLLLLFFAFPLNTAGLLERT
jgi:hypothetical protein